MDRGIRRSLQVSTSLSSEEKSSQFAKGEVRVWTYREDGSERGGFEVRESCAGVEDHAASSRRIDVERAGGVVHILPGDGDARDASVVECRVYSVGEQGSVGDACCDGRVADV